MVLLLLLLRWVGGVGMLAIGLLLLLLRIELLLLLLDVL